MGKARSWRGINGGVGGNGRRVGENDGRVWGEAKFVLAQELLAFFDSVHGRMASVLELQQKQPNAIQ